VALPNDDQILKVENVLTFYFVPCLFLSWQVTRTVNRLISNDVLYSTALIFNQIFYFWCYDYWYG